MTGPIAALAAIMISVAAEPNTYYLCMTYGTKEKQILNCSYKTTQKIPLNFHKKEKYVHII